MEYFEGKLLFPQFCLLHSYRTCGYFQYTKGSWLDKTLYDPTISITDYYDFSEKQFRDIMCHEMIHYYLAYFGIDKRCKHGKKFKEMAERLNRTYGLNITPYLDLSNYKKRKGAPKFTYWLLQKIGYI
jgi:predicted SprT family Zn-dependent metalloprotease